MSIGRKFKFKGRVVAINIDLLSGDVSRYIDKLGLDIQELRSSFGEGERSFYSCKVPASLIKKCTDLFQSQISGEPARCFTPGYQLKFEKNSTEQLIAQICWECDLIKIIVDSEEPKWFAFDSATKQSKQLLSFIRNVVENEM